MAESTKYMPFNGSTTTLVADFKFTTFRTKRSRAFAYVFIAVFVAFTVSLAFNPSSPWFSNIFTATKTTTTSTGSIRSQFSSIYSYLFASNSSQSLQNSSIRSLPTRNQTRSEGVHGEIDSMKLNQTTISSNQTRQKHEIVKNVTRIGEKSILKQENVTGSWNSMNKTDLVKNLINCNLFGGEWVRDESYPLYKPGSCSLIDEQFNCFINGRPDNGFQMLKWKPKSCTLPRLDGSHMLQLLRGKRLVFVGDSLNRNMWESLICILRNSVKDQTRVYEASDRHHFRSEPSYSFVFKDYNCTVEFFVAPFIVRESETKEKNGAKKETLRLYLVGASADQYKHADIVVFNIGHWWTYEKTAKGKDYYQEGSHVYNELNV